MPLAVFDGFHAWKHAVRFGFSLEGAVTCDLAGAEALCAQLAVDLAVECRDLRMVDEATYADLSSRLGVRSPHHTRVIAWGQQPVVDAGLLRVAGRIQHSNIPAVLVDGARHPGNFGAVVRVAAAANCPVVFGLGNLDPWNVDVVRGAAGLHAAVPVQRITNCEQVEGPLFALDADGDDIGSFRFPPGAVFAVGAERDGVSDEVRRRCAAVVSLPMRTGVSSMNLATSVAAALYAHLAIIQKAESTGVGPRQMTTNDNK
jgi:RNA methyltransferase, TrmH family